MVDFNGALYVYFNNRDFAHILDAVQLLTRSSVRSCETLVLLNEFFVLRHLFKFLLRYKVESTLFIFGFGGSLIAGCVRLLLLKERAVLIEDGLDQSILADAGGAHDYQRFVLKWLWVEWVEVLLGVNKYIVLNQISRKNLRVCVAGHC